MRKFMVVTLLLFSVALVGCNKNDVTKEDYNKLKESITITDGLTIVDLEDKIMNFVYNVYNPSNVEDIQEGIDSIKDILTENEYNDLISEARYNEDVQSSVDNVTVHYLPSSNSSDGMNRVYTEFSISSDNKEQKMAIEFVLNEDSKIFKHYLWYGETKYNE